MAADSHQKSVHNVLVAGAEDVVTLTQKWDAVEILNRDTGTNTLYATADNTPITAAEQNGTYVVPPGQGIKVAPGHSGGNTIVRLFSAGAAAYSVTGVTA